jgi:hypothetical protein
MAIKPEYWVGQSASETLTGDFWDSRSPFGWQPEAAEMMNISSKVNHEYLRIVFFSLDAQSPCKSKLCQGFHHFEPFSESRLFGDERILLCFHAECDIFSLLYQAALLQGLAVNRNQYRQGNFFNWGFQQRFNLSHPTGLPTGLPLITHHMMSIMNSLEDFEGTI